MRSILCLPVAVFFFFSHVQAQDPNYNGPAKVAVNSFYKMAADAQKAIEAGKTNGHFYVAGTKIKSMESSLKKIKEKDPGYSKLAEMEETYNRLKKEAETGQAEAESRVAAGRQDLHDKIKHENLLQTVLDGTQMQVGTNNLPYVDKAMADYKTAAEEALNLDLSKYTEKLA
ncbi:MAG: hypothetical protein JNM68_05495, partial [Dinghuibacter sp.]|nr:hypothetical protein [Dinghuibacter sp.]